MRAVALLALLLLAPSASAGAADEKGSFESTRPALLSGRWEAVAADGMAILMGPGPHEDIDVVGRGVLNVTTVTLHGAETPLGEVVSGTSVSWREVAFDGTLSVSWTHDVFRMAVRPLPGGQLTARIEDARQREMSPSPDEFVFRLGTHGAASFEDRIPSGALRERPERILSTGPARIILSGGEIATGTANVRATSHRTYHAPHVFEDEYSFVVATLESGHIEMSHPQVALVDPLVTVLGSMDLANATGRLVAGERLIVVRDEAVHLEGDLRLRMQKGDAPGIPLVAFEVVRTYAVEGEVSAYRVGLGPVVKISASTAVIGAAGLAVAVAFFGALYTRLTHTRVLEAPTRRALLAAVQARPGIHLRALQRHVGVGWGRFHYHVRVLRRSGLVVFEREGTHVHVRLPGIPILAAQRLATRGAALPVHEALQRGSMTQREIRRALGLSAALVSHHVRALERDGLVVRIAGWPPRFALASRAAVGPGAGRYRQERP